MRPLCVLRQLGHRVYPRDAFRRLLRRHRGPFELTTDCPSGLSERGGGGADATGSGDGGVGRLGGRGGGEEEATPPFEPLCNGDTVDEAELL